MKSSIAYIITTTSITAIINGKVHTLGSSHPNFTLAKQALSASPQDEARILALMNVSTAITAYSEGKVSVRDGVVYYKGAPMHNYCAQKILAFMEQGLDYKRLTRFMDRLLANPSKRAVDELYVFLEKMCFPLTEEGKFLAYKSVRQDYYSVTAGDKTKVLKGKTDAAGRIYNGVGEEIEVERNYVDDNKSVGCSSGLHCSTHQYASTFHTEGHLLVVAVDPSDVISIPEDSGCQKLRACRYVVIEEVKYDYTLPSEFSDSDTGDGDDEYTKALRVKANSQSRGANGRFN